MNKKLKTIFYERIVNELEVYPASTYLEFIEDNGNNFIKFYL